MIITIIIIIISNFLINIGQATRTILRTIYRAEENVNCLQELYLGLNPDGDNVVVVGGVIV